MRRFDRLRRAARKMAAEKGHDLGVFQKCPMEFWNPGMRRHIMKGWMWSWCIKCGEEVLINTEISPHPDKNGQFHGTDPLNPFIDIRAIQNTSAIQKAQECAGLKGDFPKRSQGVILGKEILLKECRGDTGKKNAP